MTRTRHGHGPRDEREPRPPWSMHFGRAAREWFGSHRGGGRRMRRGDVRTAVLTLLAEGPMHGYEVMHELEERSHGTWRPSPGSIYPTLQLLEDEGLVTGQERDGKRVYSLTDAGRKELEARAQRTGGVPPWELGRTDDAEGFAKLRVAVFQLGAAAMQVASTGSTDQVERAEGVVAEARRKLYQILAEA